VDNDLVGMTEQQLEKAVPTSRFFAEGPFRNPCGCEGIDELNNSG
jgi:hypothetical protein